MPQCGCHRKCGCINHNNIYPEIQSLLEPCEQVLFTGNFTESTLKLYPEISNRIESVEVDFPSLGAKGFCYVQFSCMSTKDELTKFVDLAFDIALYNNNLATGQKIGQISCINLQRDELADCQLLRSGPVVKSFDINSSSGAFKNVSRVLLDFRNPVRVFYFLGKY